MMPHECLGVSNDRQIDIFQQFVQLNDKENIVAPHCITGCLGGEPTSDWPHKGPIMWKIFPYHDITRSLMRYGPKYNVVDFLQNVRASYGVSFVSLKSDLYSLLYCIQYQD